MPHFTGKNLHIEYIWGTAQGVVNGTALFASDFRALEWEEQIDTVDVTAGADTDKAYLPTLRETALSMTLLDNGTAGSAVHRALRVGNYGTLTFGPVGTALGSPKYSCAAWVTGFETDYPFDGEVEIQAQFKKDGAWIANYNHTGATY